MFANPTPLERRASTGDRASSRRRSVQVEDDPILAPEYTHQTPDISKAAKVLGVNPAKLSRSKSERKPRSRDIVDEDVFMTGADNDPASIDRTRDRKRKPKSKFEEDPAMVDPGRPLDNAGQFGHKRSDSGAKKLASGIGGVFGGLLSKTRSDSKRRNTYLTDDENARGLRRDDPRVRRGERVPSGGEADIEAVMAGVEGDEEREARRAARRARRAEREAADRAAGDVPRDAPRDAPRDIPRERDAPRAKDEDKEARRERRRKREEEIMEARRQEEREARRAARREQKAREDSDRLAEEAKEAERAERRRARRAEREREARADAAVDDAARMRKPDRRKSHADVPDEEEERRRRREERRAQRAAEEANARRRKSVPAGDKHSRDAEPRYMPAEGRVYRDSRKEREKPSWVHSGMDSWVNDHSDAPPPPEDAPITEAPMVEDTLADEDARRRLRRTRRQAQYIDEEDERRRRHEIRRREREREAMRSSEGSQPENQSRNEAMYTDPVPVPVAPAKGSWWRKFTG
ncbi:hypothetical protein F5884DRAFT_170872 [Xylogone sp. PMI_703]|nr:hypothetical protein F5884DRAFT_170872 [Xylogone sp. PMI_703]